MRFLFRLASFLAALLAFVMIVVDGTTMISAREFDYTSLGELLARFASPGALDRLLAGLSTSLHPLVARVFHIAVLAPPAVINLAILALAAWMIGRKPEPEEALFAP